MLGLGSWTGTGEEAALGLGVFFPRTEDPLCPEVYLTPYRDEGRIPRGGGN